MKKKMEDERKLSTSKSNKKSGAKRTSIKNGTGNKICTVGQPGNWVARSYNKRDRIRQRICILLTEGIPTPKVCTVLDIQKSREAYHRQWALKKKVLRVAIDGRPRIYGKGVNFDLLAGGEWSTDILLYTRVHSAQGNTISLVALEEGNNEYTRRGKRGARERRVLFSDRHDRQGNLYHWVEIEIPEEIVGHDGDSRATLTLRRGKGRPRIAVSLPGALASWTDLEAAPPLGRSLCHVKSTLERFGWVLSEGRFRPKLHYAFHLPTVRRLAPEALHGVRFLSRRGSEEELVIYLDRSEKGLGKMEWETTSSRIARDVLGMLRVAHRDKRGDVH